MQCSAGASAPAPGALTGAVVDSACVAVTVCSGASKGWKAGKG